MEEGLFPEDSQELEEDPAGDSSGEEYDTGYKRSMEWDQETGDFVRDSTGRIAEADGYISLFSLVILSEALQLGLRKADGRHITAFHLGPTIYDNHTLHWSFLN